MEQIDKIKIVVVAAVTALTSWLGALAIPVYTMVGFSIIDYATGLTAAKKRGQKVDSHKGFEGMGKKIFMWLLVVVGFLMDQLLFYCINTLGMPFQVSLKLPIATLAAIWISFNEAISLLENISDIIGEDHMPKWLLPIVKNLKSKIDKEATTDGKENTDAKTNSTN